MSGNMTGMNMSGMNMGMGSSSNSSSSSSASMMGMDMGMMMGGDSCKISMLWNWYTVDACFLSSTWHIKNNGMFAASCIGVALLTVSLEFLRRLSREYDGMLMKQWRAHAVAVSQSRLNRLPSFAHASDDRASSAATSADNIGDAMQQQQHLYNQQNSITMRATILQQIIRTVLHAVTFGVAYIIMLLAMYFNGFIIISIILGAGLGKFLCDWMVVTLPLTVAETTCVTGQQRAQAAANQDAILESKSGAFGPSTLEEPTVCCG